jgi:micrococcal nuclease
MKPSVYLFPLIFLSMVLCGKPSSPQEWIKVKWINDGDTIVLADGRHVRYIGINAPEIDHEGQKAEPFGYKAKNFNRELLLNKRIRLEMGKEKNDRYGRLLAHVFRQDGVFVNKRMIEEGYAYVLPLNPNIKYSKTLLMAQQSAMKAQKGIWSNWKEKDNVYWGNRRSKRFHHPTCSVGKRIKRTNRRVFIRKWDAFWAGYAPSKRCIKIP